jgi:putative peptidoglycan lipid II flippase
MLWMMVPGTIGLAATQVNLLVNTILATSQGTGAVSWLNYAFRLMQFPIGIFGVSLASATLPRVSQQWVQKDIKGVSQTLTQSLKSVFAINLPASAGLAFLGYPIIELIFQYGRFYSEDTRSTATALAMYSVGLTAYSAVKVLVPACYALGNTRLPVVSSILAVAVTILLNSLMVRPFGYWGLALGTSIAALVNAVFLIRAIKKIIQAHEGDLQIGPLIRSFFEYLGVSLLMGLVCFGSQMLLSHWISDRFFSESLGKVGLPLARSLRMILLVSEGILVFLLLAKLFRLREANEVVHLFTGKLKKKLRRRPT